MFSTNGLPPGDLPPGNLPQVANGNVAAVDPEAMRRQIRDLAVCVDEITTRTALSSLTSLIEAARSEGDLARAATVATETAEGAKVLEAHIRRLLAAAASL